MNESVRRDLEEKVLASDVARRALEARLEQRDSGLSPLQKEALEAQLASLDDEAKRLAAAIRKAPDIDVLLDELQKVEARRKLIKADLTVRPKVDAGALLDAKLDEWRRILRDPDVRQAQSIIRACVETRIYIWNKEGGGISWAAHCDFSNLLCGVVGVPANTTLLASPTGGIPEWTREVPGEVRAVGAGGKAA